MEVRYRDTLLCNKVVLPDGMFRRTDDSTIETPIIGASTKYVFYKDGFLQFCLHFITIELLETLGQLCNSLPG